jgi:SNF2 family DNA or RNA helicase
MDTISNSPDSKAIIFTERRVVAEDIYTSLQKEDTNIALLHHGRFSDECRSKTLNQFKTDDSRRILVSTRRALEVGVNLQCANVVIFNDMPWSPADINQAAGRVRRLDQKKPVSEYWMKSNTNFDERLLSILEEKLKLIKQYAEGMNL